jgi:hypothetical protein
LADPVAPLLMAIQLTLLEAVQEQPVPAVTLTNPVPPVAGADALVVDGEAEQLETMINASGTLCVLVLLVAVMVRL